MIFFSFREEIFNGKLHFCAIGRLLVPLVLFNYYKKNIRQVFILCVAKGYLIVLKI